jgi:hypothetical protein
MKKLTKNQITSLIANISIPIILTNLGIFVLKEFTEKIYLGVSIILIGFSLLYFTFYSIQIKTNQEKIKNLEECVIKINKEKESEKKLLNTIKDIVILDKVKKLK